MPNLLSLINDPSLAFITRLAGRGRSGNSWSYWGSQLSQAWGALQAASPPRCCRRRRRLPLRLLIGGTSASAASPGEGGRQDRVAATASGNLSSLLARTSDFPSSNRVPARHRLDPSFYPPLRPPPKVETPCSQESHVWSGPGQGGRGRFLGSAAPSRP